MSHATPGDGLASPAPVALCGEGLTAVDVARIAHGAGVVLDPDAVAAVAANRLVLEQAIARGEPIYGVTTGLGALAREHVAVEDAGPMQRDILRSHAAGVGAPLPHAVVRAALAVRLNGLLRARSGVRPVILERIAELLNLDLVPRVPRTGSLGASGDLAPSAHAFLPLIGEGELSARGGAFAPAADVLAAHALAPLELAAKEALALINGTHFMAGIGALLAVRCRALADSADAIAALALEALGGASAAFDARVHALRDLPGQRRSAEIVRAMTAGSERIDRDRGRVQDAYSLRCIPQVHGAAREAFAFFARLVETDANSVTDNPIVFEDPPQVVSAGNFHGQALALGLDTLRIALADLASISERRSYRLVSPSLNGDLPAFLTRDSGRCSGYMVAHYAAAALVGELRALAHPASVDSVPTSDGQEDHVSMGMTSALLALECVERAEAVLAVEALCACQAVEFGSGRLGAGSRRVLALVRERVPPLGADRPPSPDIEVLTELVASGAIAGVAAEVGDNPVAMTGAGELAARGTDA